MANRLTPDLTQGNALCISMVHELLKPCQLKMVKPPLSKTLTSGWAPSSGTAVAVNAGGQEWGQVEATDVSGREENSKRELGGTTKLTMESRCFLRPEDGSKIS